MGLTSAGNKSLFFKVTCITYLPISELQELEIPLCSCHRCASRHFQVLCAQGRICRHSPVAPRALGTAATHRAEERKWFGKEHTPAKGCKQEGADNSEIPAQASAVDTRAGQRLCLTCWAEQRAACSGCRAAQKMNSQQLFVLWPQNPAGESCRTCGCCSTGVQGPKKSYSNPSLQAFQR